MVNVRHETVPILTKYLEAGGEVLALSPPADYVDGEPSEDVKKLAQRYSSQWHFMDSLPNLLSGIRSRLEPGLFQTANCPMWDSLSDFWRMGIESYLLPILD